MKHIWYFAGKLNRYAGKKLYFNMMGMLTIGLLDGAAVLLLLPLLGIIGIVSAPSAGMPFLDKLAFLQELPTAQALVLVLLFFVALTTMQSLLQRSLSLREVKIHTGFINQLRLETYRMLLQANWSFFITKRKSDLINALTGELGRVTGGAFLFLQMLASILFTMIQIGLAFWLSWQLSLFVLGCGLIIGLLSRRFIAKSKQLGSVSVDLAKHYLAGISDHFNGMKDIKSHLLEGSRYQWLQDWSTKIEAERYEFTRMRSNSQLFYKVASAVLIAVFVFAGASLFQAQAPQMLLITVLFARLWPRFTGIQSQLEQLASALPGFKVLEELQRECLAEQDEVYVDHGDSAIEPLSITSGLELRDVCYRYVKTQPGYTLKHVHLHIPAGGMTAIVGKSGAGKSTIVDLLLGLIHPEQGEIVADGKTLSRRDMLRLRRSIGYVPQEAFLYHGSIRDNLTMMSPDATEAELWEAMEFAAVADFVRSLPDGLDTLIGDRGVMVSGGERQRLVLARAILRKPSLLILDEATSALDSVNESIIQMALERLKGRMTIVVVAHRYTTIRNADQVVVVDDGRIIQSGPFDRLSKEEGLFSALLGRPASVAL
ncbi:ABC transporter ATP-binding protein [Paenibacillus sp. CAU 1782]